MEVPAEEDEDAMMLFDLSKLVSRRVVAGMVEMRGTKRAFENFVVKLTRGPVMLIGVHEGSRRRWICWLVLSGTQDLIPTHITFRL